MALTTCPDCSNQVSDAAPACPKCGRPSAGATAQPVSVQKGVGVGTGVKLGFGMFIILPILLFVGACLFFVTLYVGAASQYETYRQKAREQRAAREAAQASAVPTLDVLSGYEKPRVMPTMGLRSQDANQ